jgi:hypothetical protein
MELILSTAPSGHVPVLVAAAIVCGLWSSTRKVDLMVFCIFYLCLY